MEDNQTRLLRDGLHRVRMSIWSRDEHLVTFKESLPYELERLQGPQHHAIQEKKTGSRNSLGSRLLRSKSRVLNVLEPFSARRDKSGIVSCILELLFIVLIDLAQNRIIEVQRSWGRVQSSWTVVCILRPGTLLVVVFLQDAVDWLICKLYIQSWDEDIHWGHEELYEARVENKIK